MKDLANIGKNAIWHLIGKIVNTILSIILVFFLARFLGPENYGIFSLTVTFILLIYQLTSFGLEHSLPYFIQKFNNTTRSLINNFLSKRILITVTSSICLYLLSGIIASNYNNESLADYLKLTSIFIPFFVLMQASYFIFQGLNKLKESMKIDILFSSLKFISLILIIIGLSVSGTIIGYGLSYIITTIFAYTIIYKKLLKKGEKFTQNNEFNKYAIISFIGAIFYFLSTYLINLFLGSNPIELGLFDASNKVILILSLIPASLGTALLPNITNKKKNEINELTKRFLKYIIIYLMPIITIFISSSGFVIKLLLGNEYLTALNFFKIITIASAIQSINLFYETISYGTGKPKTIMNSNIIKTVIILSLSTYLTTAFNSSIIMLITSIIGFAYMNIKLRTYLKHPIKDYIKTVISAIPLLIILLLEMNIYVKATLTIISLITYLLIVYNKILDEQDKYFIKRLLIRITKNYIK